MKAFVVAFTLLLSIAMAAPTGPSNKYNGNHATKRQVVDDIENCICAGLAAGAVADDIDIACGVVADGVHVICGN